MSERRNSDKPHGLQPSPPRNTWENLQGGSLVDALDKINATPTSRRTAIGFSALASVTALTGLANVAKRYLSHNETTTVVETNKSPELLNDIVYLDRDPITKQLGYTPEGHVAQSLDVVFHEVVLKNYERKKITVRKEHHASTDTNLYQEFDESVINGLDIKVRRVGAMGYKGDNDTNEDPHYCFKSLDANGVPQYVYEWLLLVKDTNDPSNPSVYVDGQGKISETPWFVGPNFVDTSGNT